MVCTANIKETISPARIRIDDLEELESLVDSQVRQWVCGLKVEQTPAGLVLSGRSRSYYGKQLAQAALLDATTLRLVANEIEVL